MLVFGGDRLFFESRFKRCRLFGLFGLWSYSLLFSMVILSLIIKLTKIHLIQWWNNDYEFAPALWDSPKLKYESVGHVFGYAPFFTVLPFDHAQQEIFHWCSISFWTLTWFQLHGAVFRQMEKHITIRPFFAFRVDCYPANEFARQLGTIPSVWICLHFPV